eukprot:PhM_4_TR13699/c2_g1_i15/m.45046
MKQWLSPAKTRISRHMGRDAETLLEWGLLEKGPALTYSHLFKVPKGDKARLIVDCRDINEVLPAPETMPLPHLHALFDAMLESDYVAQYDARSYFYQFPLVGEARDIFGVALADHRGAFQKFRLTVLPMGFKHAPYIAQTTSNFILENCGPGAGRAAWLDNFLFWGDEDTVKTTTAAFKEVCRFTQVDLKPTEDEGRVIEVLGVVLDLNHRRISLAPKNAERLTTSLHNLKDNPTPRTLFGVFGTALWALYAVARSPLCCHEAFVRIISQHSPKSRDEWDKRIALTGKEWEVIEETVETALASCWTPPTPANTPVPVWTDASESSLGWVFETIQGEWWAASHVPGETIFLRELLAMAKGVHAVQHAGGTAAVLGDNTAAVQACRRGYSRNPKANVILRRLVNIAPAWFAWVPTTLQRADALTRGATVPGPQQTCAARAWWPRWG